jgi:hypothetical protein
MKSFLLLVSKDAMSFKHLVDYCIKCIKILNAVCVCVCVYMYVYTVNNEITTNKNRPLTQAKISVRNKEIISRS